MSKWFYKHYKLVCMIFLGVVLVGWTAFTDISDRKEATADVGLEKTAENTQSGDKDVSGTPAPTAEISDTADEGQITDEPVPTEVVSADPVITDMPAVSDIPDTPAGDGAGTAPTAEGGQESGESAEGTEPEVTDPGQTGEAGTGEGENTENTDPVVTDVPEDTQPIDDTPAFDLTFKYAVAAVESRLNIRLSASTDSIVIAYLKSNGYCEVLEWGSEWTKIKSGTVTGYAYTPYLLFNNDAIKKLKSLNKLFVRVTSNTVNIRAAATTESEKLGRGTRDSKFMYLPEQSVEGWYCIQYSETQIAYVSADYTEVYIDTSVAIPIS